MPGKGPRPTATTNTMATRISGMDRISPNNNLMGWDTQGGVTFDAARKPNGKAKITPRIVPAKAIISVSMVESITN